MEKAIQTELSNFVGRETEMNELNENLSLVFREKQPRFIFIEGEGGIGKSTLVHQFLKNVADRPVDDQHPAWMIAEGNCEVASQGIPFAPFSEIFRALKTQGVRLRIISGNLFEFVKTVASTWLDVLTAKGVGTAVKTTIEAAAKLGSPPQQFYSPNVYAEFCEFLKRLTVKHPAVLYLDALESADESTLRLVFYLINQLSNVPVLVLATYRPTEMRITGIHHKVFRDLAADISLKRKHCVINIPLEPGLDVAAYLNKRYPKNTFPPQLAKIVQQYTDGFPLFVSQLFPLWESEGIIIFSGEDPVTSASISCNVDEIHLSIPSGLEDLLEKRIDKLKELDKNLCELIQNASVEGEQFTAEVIAGLSKIDDTQAVKDLDSLDSLYNLVHPQGDDGIDSKGLSFYRFVHIFIRDYVYEITLSKNLRSKLHKEIGNRIEQLYIDDVSQVAEQLSLHFENAGDFKKASHYAFIAASKRRSPPAWIEAVHWCDTGLRLVAHLPSSNENKLLKYKLLEQAAYCYNAGGGGGQVGKAIEKFRSALALGQEIQVDYERIGAIYARLADIYELIEDYDSSEKIIIEGLDLFAQHGMPLCSARLELEALQAFNQMRGGEENEARAKWQQVLNDGKSLSAETPFERFASRIVYWIAISFSNQGQYRKAIDSYKDSIRRAEAVGAVELTLTSQLNMADEYLKLCEVDESEKIAEKVLALAKQMGDQDNEAYALAVQGGCHLGRGDVSRAIEKFNQAIALFEKIDSKWNLSYTYAELAYGYSLESKFEEADTAGKKAFYHAFGGDDKYAQGYVLDRLAQIEFAHGDNELAEQHFKKAIALFDEGKYDHFLAKAKLHYARLLLKQGKRDQIAGLLPKILETFEALGIKPDIDETRKLLEEA